MADSISVPLSDAKTNFSSIIHNVRDIGESYTITLRNKPVAMVVPIPQQPPKSSSTRGALSSYSDKNKRYSEKNAFMKAVEAKHAHNS